ncbi:hypothetical protein NSP_40710 [Nodularia spumigena CCY9414]|nr:hypothetical protein NSP_40710 [Nodularia spumigena CCY9414]
MLDKWQRKPNKQKINLNHYDTNTPRFCCGAIAPGLCLSTIAPGDVLQPLTAEAQQA